MTLSGILRQYLKKGENGVLSVKLQDEAHLFKVYIEDGEVIYITLGTSKNEECLKSLKNALPVEHFFLKGVKAPARAEGVLTQSLLESLGIEEITAKSTATVKPDEVQRLEVAFVELIGPIGKLIIEDNFSKLGYRRGEPIPQEDYSRLVESLSKELPASEQGRFISKFKI
jgi:hypothetical protein